MIIQKGEYLIDGGSASPAFSFVLRNCASESSCKFTP